MSVSTQKAALTSCSPKVGQKMATIGCLLAIISLITISVGVINHCEAVAYEKTFSWIPFPQTHEMIADKFAVAKEIYIGGAIGLGVSLGIILMGKKLFPKAEKKEVDNSYLPKKTLKTLALISLIIALSILFQSSIHNQEAIMIDQKVEKMSPTMQAIFKEWGTKEHALASTLFYTGIGVVAGSLVCALSHKMVEYLRKKNAQIVTQKTTSWLNYILYLIGMTAVVAASVTFLEGLIHQHNASFLKEIFGPYHFLVDDVVNLENQGSALFFNIAEIATIGGVVSSALLAYIKYKQSQSKTA